MANATYFADSDPAPSAPPDGFNGFLTRQQWRGVVDFSQAVGARIVTSLRDKPGHPRCGRRLATGPGAPLPRFYPLVGGTIAAAEFMNEPNLTTIGGAPAGYDAGRYGRDSNCLHSFVKENFPEMIVLGPGATGDAPRFRTFSLHPAPAA